MKYSYGQFDGNRRFLSPDELFPSPKVMQFILQYGQDALDAMENLEGDEADFIEQMIAAGLLELVEDGEDEDGKGRYRLSPKMVKGLQHRALLEIFEGMRQGSKEGHPTADPGRTTERTDGTKAYEFGDPISEIDLGATLRNAVRRQPPEGGDRLPIRLGWQDFELHVTEGSTDCATVMLIDQSGSMMRYGRFYQAKRVALGMAAMLAGKFPQDTIDYIGFHSLAERIEARDLPLVMPKPVSIRDHEVRVRCPLEQACANPDRIPLHFTNLHLGLRMARQLLAQRSAANKQIFIITDGQPTAHVEPNPAGGGDMLYLLYPPTEQSRDATLREALRCQQQGIRLATFALIEDYWGMDWVGFVDRMTRLTRGMAYYCTSEDLSSTVIESYLKGKKTKTFIH